MIIFSAVDSMVALLTSDLVPTQKSITTVDIKTALRRRRLRESEGNGTPQEAFAYFLPKK